MSNFVVLFVLAVIQGFSEWLPVSSSGHLVLFSRILGYPNNIEMDVAMHFGTLMAIFVYFGRDIIDIVEDMLKLKWKSKNSRLGWMILISSIPAGIIGFSFEKYFEAAFGSLIIVMIGFLISSVVLMIASLDFHNVRVEKENMGIWKALFIGLGQALAIFPGVSRSGSTISAGLLSGLDEKDAMKFSFLMAIPVIFGAGLLELGNNTIPSEMLWATLVSFFVGMVSIHLLLKVFLTSKKNLRWFAFYVFLLALGIGIYLIISA